MPSISRNIWWFEIDFLYSGSLWFFSKSVPITRNFLGPWKDTITLFSIFIVNNLRLILIDIFSHFQGLPRSVSSLHKLWPESNRFKVQNSRFYQVKDCMEYGMEYGPYSDYRLIFIRLFSKRSLVFKTNRTNTIEPDCQGLKIYSFNNNSSSRLFMDHYQEKGLIREQKICWI